MTLQRKTALVVGLMLVAAACGSDADSGTQVEPSVTEATAAPVESAPETAPVESAPENPPIAEVAVAESSLGQILVDADGLTLYGFTNDTDGESTCYDDCAQAWPPFTGDPAADSGLDASLFTTVARTDGTSQIVVGDWPLYYFAGDSAPGDVNGQNVGEVWFVVAPDGSLVPVQTATEIVAEGSITVAESSLGQILVDADGLTLYGFTNDTDGETTCYETCAENWPPVSGETPVDTTQLDGDLFRVVERTDGTTQLALGDWPLYYFAGDSDPGDVNGQNVGEVWFVVAPDGSLVR